MILAGALVALLAGPACANTFFAAPGATDNGQCTRAAPCTPQGAVLACHASIRRHKEVISGDSITIYLSSGRTVTMMEEWREPECQFSGVVTTRRPSGQT